MDLLHPSIPTATYRLQFHRGFTFNQAKAIVPYLHRLGVSHVYASPYFQARAGSTHGYDIGDHNTLNAEIGTREEYDAFIAELHAHDMRQVLDIVPNHMGIGEPVNQWWMDVLENGPASPFAPYFDIDWQPLKEELTNKVLLPILGDQYGRVLEKGELKLEFTDGAFFLRYYENILPLNPRSYAIILNQALERLAGQYAQDFYIEIQSIITALDHLPRRTDDAPNKVEERAREKEVVKRRLVRLCNDCPQVGEAIVLAMRQIEGRPGDRRSFDVFDALLEAQPYRLSYWRVASEEINYRRFFDINDLAAIRVELPEVFEATHRLIFELIKSGAVNGLRIDHVDGLWNPREYLGQLQRRYAELCGLGDRTDGLYLLVEKILMHGEHLRADWSVSGTTGYEFTNEILAALIDRSAEKAITESYNKFLGYTARFDEIVYRAKQQTMRFALSSEMNVLAHILNRLSEKNRRYRDYTLNSLTAALREMIAFFPVYRTYATSGSEVSEEGARVIREATRNAKRANRAIEASIFDFVRDLLLYKFPEEIDDADRAEHVRFVMKFQQCTGPIMAKSLEDTAFYVFNRLVALNEVGGEPQHFGAPLSDFHAQNAARLASHPHSMLCTSTHDTKRSEDVRMRIAAISEIPALWRRSLQTWKKATRKLKTEVDGQLAPDANEEYLIYQILLGAWPLEPMDEAGRAEFIGRIQAYMTKAIKEAKVNSSWIQPNEAWDEAVGRFIEKMLTPASGAAFLQEFEPVAAQIAQLGALNSLTQTVLKCTVPGVPDFYQGNETWDFSLVDPDNRRPVDYDRRAAMLDGDEASPADLLSNWRDGRIKLFAASRLLRLRRDEPELFAQGTYEPLKITGEHADSVIAFQREHGGKRLVVIVPRLTARVGFPATGEAWGDTAVELPGETTDIFTGRPFSPRLAETLRDFPCAVG